MKLLSEDVLLLNPDSSGHRRILASHISIVHFLKKALHPLSHICYVSVVWAIETAGFLALQNLHFCLFLCFKLKKKSANKK